MTQTEKFKQTEIKGHTFRIRKFGARDGSFIVTKVSGILAPMIEPLLKGLDPRKILGSKSPSDIDLQNLNIAAVIGPLSSISEADFSYLQDKCLRICDVQLPAGWMPIVNDNGSFALEELEDDGMTVMALMVHALMHNLAGFFSGSPLQGFVGGLLATNQQNS